MYGFDLLLILSPPFGGACLNQPTWGSPGTHCHLINRLLLSPLSNSDKAPRAGLASTHVLSRQFCPLGSFLPSLPIWVLEVGLTAGMRPRLQLLSNQDPFLWGLGPQAALQASSSCTRLTARDDVLLLPLPLALPLAAATLCPDAVAAAAATRGV